MIFIAWLVTMAAMISTSKGKPMRTCDDQSKCITWTQVQRDRAVCDGTATCEWTICAMLDLTAGNCPKSAGDTISHVCNKDKDNNDCTGDNDPDTFAGIVEDVGLANGYSQCQTGTPGQELKFLFKDGSGCNFGGAAGGTFPLDGMSLSCEPRPESIPSCTGNDIGVECIWTAVVPACDYVPPPAPPPVGPGGPINSCPYQKDCLDWSVNVIDGEDDDVCEGDCEVEVCVKLDFNNENCRKSSSDSVSHVCKKSDGVCNPHSGFYDATSVSDVSNEYEQCQRGTPGQELQFLFKDGRGCDVRQRDGDVDPDPFEDDVTITGDSAANYAEVSCAPRACCLDTTNDGPVPVCGTGGRWLNSAANGVDCTGGTSSCTGNAPGNECVWTFTIPEGVCSTESD